MKTFLATAFCCLSLLAATLPSARAADAGAAPQQDEASLMASLHFEQGTITLPGKVATLRMPDSFRYLSPADASRVLVAWGNPPDDSTLGMIVPAAPGPLSPNSWAVVLTYDGDGHVKDGDADTIDYDKLLKEMQASQVEGNVARKKAGYAAIALVGWAEHPSYDKTSHKMVWAKQIRDEESGSDSLNYNVRVLGRQGVLVLNAIANMDQLAQITREMQTVTAFTEFTPGNRYADFDSKTDKVAEYGLAALVAGGVAAKLGLFGKLFALLLAFKKVLFIGVAALGATLFKRFKRAPQAAVPTPASVNVASAPVSLDKPPSADR